MPGFALNALSQQSAHDTRERDILWIIYVRTHFCTLLMVVCQTNDTVVSIHITLLTIVTMMIRIDESLRPHGVSFAMNIYTPSKWHDLIAPKVRWRARTHVSKTHRIRSSIFITHWLYLCIIIIVYISDASNLYHMSNRKGNLFSRKPITVFSHAHLWLLFFSSGYLFICCCCCCVFCAVSSTLSPFPSLDHRSSVVNASQQRF